jgi:cytochrome c-type biogenesis protein CcmE
MNKKRQQKIIIIVAAFALFAVACGLALYSLKENINLFFTPKQIEAGEVKDNSTIRLGGLVLPNTWVRDESLTSTFIVSDGFAQVKVHYQGILPDLFREGQGVVALGKLSDGELFATEILAKHDENYMPPEVNQALEESGYKNHFKKDTLIKGEQ